ncbi:hypothetical protein GGX14DRAFT_472566 [Mycena pura]|uniref:Uncharacterized protein n=1 Tax=Mycena pura TaxID=153505 RepID=A0AAD6Y390_9AGAR|nr:hypothetical protein GGX14DRAFT_472566 [Mycena pura]
MARFFSLLVTLFIAAAAVAAPVAVPVEARAGLGGIACNVNRFKIVTTLAATSAAVGKIPTADSTTASAVTTAKAGLKSASDGIGQIALALVTGGAPPAAARDQTQKGLLDAQTALTSINDPTAASSTASAMSKLAAAIQDGNNVVADC